MKATRNRRAHHQRQRGGKPQGGGSTPGSIGSTIAEAAMRWEVPIWVLFAVKLLETGSGSGIGAKSSAGAIGPFQFLPSTAASLGVRDPNNLHEAADGAAHYLRQNYEKFGSWNAALEAYNGGPGAVGKGYAYNEADAKQTLRDNGLGKLVSSRKNVGLLPDWAEELPLVESLNPFNWFKGDPAETPPGQEFGRVKDAASTGLGGIGDAIGVLTDVQTWVRLIEVVAGFALIYMALKTLTGTGASDLPGAKIARSAVRI